MVDWTGQRGRPEAVGARDGAAPAVGVGPGERRVEAVAAGWCWGPKDFREDLLEMIGPKQGPQPYGEELEASEEQKAQRLVTEMLRAAA
jgi:hypothetical protein